ncbi:MAG: type II toxin-antitoxin system VapC family toxin [Vicinamibacterales bacterium]
MRFWDATALLPLLVREGITATTQECYREDPTVVVAWTTPVECAGAIARAEREGLLDQVGATAAFARLDALAATWHEVEPSADVRDIARRLLRVHRLGATEAIHLASATLAAERRPASLTILTTSERFEAAALREGFRVEVPGRGEW